MWNWATTKLKGTFNFDGDNLNLKLQKWDYSTLYFRQKSKKEDISPKKMGNLARKFFLDTQVSLAPTPVCPSSIRVSDFHYVSVSETSQSVETTLGWPPWWLTWWLTWRRTWWPTWRWTRWPTRWPTWWPTKKIDGANMEVDKAADKAANMVADMVADKVASKNIGWHGVGHSGRQGGRQGGRHFRPKAYPTRVSSKLCELISNNFNPTFSHVNPFKYFWAWKPGCGKVIWKAILAPQWSSMSTFT